MYDDKSRQGNSNRSIDDSLADTVKLLPSHGLKGTGSIPRDTPTAIIIDELAGVASEFFPIPKSGGFATMFGYKDLKGHSYCVKVLRREHLNSQRSVQHFIREYQFLKTLYASQAGEIIRPHALIRVGERPDALAMVLEYVPSDTLLDVKFDLDKDEKIDAGRRLAEILAKVHEQGVVHNDLKPDNVFYEDSCGWPNIKLFDFGLARGIDETVEADPYVIEGTPLYIAPEVMVSSEYASPLSDIYSFGAVMFELFVGYAPYSSPEEHSAGPAVNELFARKARGDITRLGAQLLESGVPFRTGGIILNCLCNNPNNRYQSVDQIVREL